MQFIFYLWTIMLVTLWRKSQLKSSTLLTPSFIWANNCFSDDRQRIILILQTGVPLVGTARCFWRSDNFDRTQPPVIL